MGTLLYQAPEVALGLPYNQTADVYAFAVTAWEIISRKLPYLDERTAVSDDQFRNRVFLDDPPLRPSLRLMERKVPNQQSAAQLSSLLAACWHPQCEIRPSMLDVHRIVCDCYSLLTSGEEASVAQSDGMFVSFFQAWASQRRRTSTV